MGRQFPAVELGICGKPARGRNFLHGVKLGLSNSSARGGREGGRGAVGLTSSSRAWSFASCGSWAPGSAPGVERRVPGWSMDESLCLSEPRFPRRWRGRAAVPAWWGYPEIQAGVRFIILGGWELYGVQMVCLRSNSPEDLG